MKRERTGRFKSIILLTTLTLLISCFSGISAYGLIRVEEDSSKVVYSENWQRHADSSHSKGFHMVSNEQGATAKIAFVGTYIKWVGAKYRNRGVARVYIDGVPITNGDTALPEDDGDNKSGVDLYNPTWKAQEVLFSKTGLQSGWHELKIEVADKRNTSSIGYYISLDAFEADYFVGAPPRNLSVSTESEGAKLKLSWTNPSDSDFSYVQIWRIDSRYQPPASPTYDRVTDSSKIDSGLVAGVTYSYYLVGVDKSGYRSIPTDKVSGTPLPPVPSNVTVVNEGTGGKLIVRWKNPVNPSTFESIRIYRSTAQGVLGVPVALDNISKSVNSYTDTGLTNGVTYYYTVRTVDLARNESINTDQHSGTPAASTTYFEEDSSTINYTGTWWTGRDPYHSGGTHNVSNAARSRATFTFYGTSVAWIAAKGPNRGTASVTLDSMNTQTIDLYSPNWLYQQKVYVKTGLSDTAHKLVIEVTNTKNKSSSDYYISVDAFATGVSATEPPPVITPVAGVTTVGSGEIVGRVVNQAGQTIPGTAVRVNTSVMPTNPGGEFRFTLVHSGTYTVYYDAPGYRGQTQVIEVKAGQATRCPTVIMDPGITPSTQGEIFGRVVNPAHQPIAWAAVRINSVVIPTNAAGEFRFQLVNPGVYTIYYDAAGYAGQTQVIEVKAGMITYPPMVIMSGMLGEIYGKVLDAATGRAIPGTAVRVDSSVMPTNAGGEFRFTLVHPGVYKVNYDAPGYKGQVQENIAVFAGSTTICPTVLMWK